MLRRSRRTGGLDVDVRRVVTGHGTDGKAVFVSDEQVPAIEPTLLPGNSFHRLWGAEEAPRFPDEGVQPEHRAYFPSVGGFRFGLFSIPPDDGPGLPAGTDVAAGLAEVDELLPGLTGHMEPGAPGMHTTATVDFEVVLFGSCVLELDDGATVTLGPGDTVVQNGTRHRWSNPGSEPCTLAVFLVGAHHDRVG